MLRQLYRCALRLHPSGFRRRFGDEMLSIFDHAPGKADALRLLLDALISAVRQSARRVQFWHAFSRTAAPQPVTDGPSFSSLDPFRPRAAAVIHGMVLSITLFCMTCFAIRYSWIHVLHVRIPEVQFERPQWMPPRSTASEPSRDASVSPTQETNAQTAFPSAVAPGMSQRPVGKSGASEGSYFVSKPPKTVKPKLQQPEETMPVTTLVGTESPAVPTSMIDAAERQRVIDGAIQNLTQYYVYPAVARKMADSLRKGEQNGDYDAAIDGQAFADLLTKQLREVSHDRHLMVIYSQTAIPGRPSGPPPEAIARYRREMERSNCTFEKVAILPHNVGYVKLNSFPDLSICQSTAVSVMASLNSADAIVFDLRDNHGGIPGMVAFMESYLFEHPTHLDDLYNRSENSTLQYWTLSPIVGNKLADKPAFVLTSAETFSGAEEFIYDLKMLKRATLVGETTAGGAHMVRRRWIDDHFSIAVPDTRPINAISKKDWERTGVTPDVNVKATDALITAERLAAKSLQASDR